KMQLPNTKIEDNTVREIEKQAKGIESGSQQSLFESNHDNVENLYQ
ncbi:1730_t:CDS:1, partial [Paraglomus occultum]